MIILFSSDDLLRQAFVVAVNHRLKVYVEPNPYDQSHLGACLSAGISAFVVDCRELPDALSAASHVARIDSTIPTLALIDEHQVELAYQLATVGVAGVIAWECGGSELWQALKNAFRVVPRVVRDAAMVPVQYAAQLIGSSAAVTRLRAFLLRAAKTTSPVIILGESGVGKGLVAQLLHQMSGRSGPLQVVNVSAVTNTLFESELFGCSKGAFTGATARQGLLRSAHEGTLFLDEIGDLSLDLQPKLLRALDGGSVRPVGGGEEYTVDTRVIAATNRPLKELMASGYFRRDLWYRLAGLICHVLPLRERKEDIPPLAYDYLAKNGFHHVQLTSSATRALQDYRWPGNVRELYTTLHRSVVMSDEPCLSENDLLFDPEYLDSSVSPIA